MTGWTFFFVLLGVCWLTSTILGAIDRYDKG